jgi:hypothetical protein
MQLSFEESDTILNFLIKSEFRYFEITTEQAEKVKSIWKLLHDFDDTNDYTFNDDFSLLRKEKKVE